MSHHELSFRNQSNTVSMRHTRLPRRAAHHQNELQHTTPLPADRHVAGPPGTVADTLGMTGLDPAGDPPREARRDGRITASEATSLDCGPVLKPFWPVLGRLGPGDRASGKLESFAALTAAMVLA
jgi:hypothetical protein